MYLHKSLYTPLSLGRKLALSIVKVFRNIHFLPHFHYLKKWVRLVTSQINTDYLINQLTKYFYTRHLTPVLYFKKRFALFVAESFRNIYFLLHFD